MALKQWLKRSVGRTLSSTKTHLIETALLLGFDATVVEQMRAASDEQCEAMFVERIGLYGGGDIDYRSKPSEIIDILSPFLRQDERAELLGLSVPGLRPPEVIRRFAGALGDGRIGMRAMDSFGDSIFVFVVAAEKLTEFDRINEHWLL